MSKRKKNKPINYTLQQLKDMSRDSYLFLNLILAHGWLSNIYTGDLEEREKLQFIRNWFNNRK